MRWSIVVVAAVAVFVQFHNQLAPSYDVPRKGDAVVVTGASSGIGRAAAEHLAREGFYVYAGVRKEEHRSIYEGAANAEAVILDVTNSEHIEQLRQKVEQSGRRLFALVNNAGVTLRFPFEYTLKQQRDQLVGVNLLGVWDVTAALLPQIKKSRGRIINIGSVSGEQSAAMMSVYAGSKSALRTWGDGLRRQLKPLGVHVSTIEPGFIRTEMAATQAVDPDDSLRQRSREYEAYFTPAYMQKVRMLLDRLSESTDVTNDAVLHALTSPQPQSLYVLTLRRFMVYVCWAFPNWVADLLMHLLEKPN